MKRLASLFLVLLFCASLQAQYATSREVAPGTQYTVTNPNPIEAVWDVLFNYNATTITTAAGNAGAIYIPTINKFWTSRWATNVGHEWASNGTSATSFTFPFTGTRGMVFDGTNIYCSCNNTTVQKVNPVTKLSTGTVSVVGAPNGARFIAYDPDGNSGAGAIIVGNWTAPNLNFYVFSLTGTLLRTITNTQASCYGLTFDKWSNPGTPYLWVFTQGAGAGTPQLILQMNYTTGVYTGVQHDVAVDVGAGQTGPIAGALYLTGSLNPDKYVLGGLLQGGTPGNDALFGYELAPIPVEFTSFTANVVDKSVTLNWSTATETNNNGFEVQRKSVDGSFSTVAFVEGHGTTTEAQNYTFIDNVEPGQYFYRLKQVDYNGWYKYTDEVEVNVTAPSVFELSQNYPNPFNPSTTINFNLAVDSKISVKVFDLLGQEVSSLLNTTLPAGAHNVNFNAAGLNSGVYFYQLDASGVDGSNFSSVKKMILTK